MPKESKEAREERQKSVTRANRESYDRLKRINSLNGIRKLRYELRIVNTHIRNCEYDLAHEQQGNSLIEEKLEIFREKREQLIDEIKEAEDEK